MSITLPDLPALNHLAMADVLMDLACGGYAAGHFSRQTAVDVAGVSRLDFDNALCARHIPTFTDEMLAEDLATLDQFGVR